MNLATINTKPGEIQVPKSMVQDMGWDRIEREVASSFKVMAAFCTDINTAWGHAVHNVYAAWSGARTLLK